MHMMAVVIVPKSMASSEEEAKDLVRGKLAEEGVGAKPGLFVWPLYDWFRIGGGYSGILKAISLGAERYWKFRRDEATSEAEEYPEISPPIEKRDGFKDGEYPDDVLPLNKEIAKYLRSEMGSVDEGCDLMQPWYWVLDGREVEAHVGNAFAVLVDLHH